jgi:O-acetylhomoserine/O-acetylserine sulfhydrylase-like pyridoxal-dependent enzyme
MRVEVPCVVVAALSILILPEKREKPPAAHPATTSHGRLSPQERASAGISDSLIRVAVGLEDLVDLKTDLARGLAVL